VAGSCRPHVASVAMAKAIAMKEGLVLAQNIACNRIMAESDSTETIDACTGDSRWRNASSVVYAYCIDIVSSIGVLVLISVRGKQIRLLTRLLNLVF
jgi:hypothetical protein